jgi:hypothetical protein
MPLSSKIFPVAPVQASVITRTLRDYNHETQTRMGTKALTLRTAVHELHASADEIRGELEYEYPVEVNYRGQVQYYPTTISRKFIFDLGRFRRSLIILEKGQDIVAQKISKIIFGNDTDIAEGRITADDISNFIDQLVDGELSISWKNVGIRGLNKVTLRGPEVKQAKADYARYNEHGKKYYVMVRLRHEKWVISISEDGKVVLYSTGNVDTEDFVRFLRTKVVSLIK